MNRTIQHIISFVVAGCLLLSVFAQSIHYFFEDHYEVHCEAENEKHIHQAADTCPSCDYIFCKQLEPEEATFTLKVPLLVSTEKWHEYPVIHLSFKSFYSLRAPPFI
ncbi:MAG: hypothetical protein GY705_10695 [Bacteroidetes bacterium]|nr:hypothetical protein [Bacteroidota bacterium]